MQANTKASQNRGPSISKLSKTIAVIAVATLGMGTGFLAGRTAAAGAGTSSELALHVSSVHVGSEQDNAGNQATEKWLGRNIVQVEDTLGSPSQVYRLKDTGGEMLIYTQSSREHFVFELDPDRTAEAAPTR